MRLRLPKLQKNNPKTREFRKKLEEDCENMESVLYYPSLPYVLKIVDFKIINYYNNDLLADCF